VGSDRVHDAEIGPHSATIRNYTVRGPTDGDRRVMQKCLLVPCAFRLGEAASANARGLAREIAELPCQLAIKPSHKPHAITWLHRGEPVPTRSGESTLGGEPGATLEGVSLVVSTESGEGLPFPLQTATYAMEMDGEVVVPSVTDTQQLWGRGAVPASCLRVPASEEETKKLTLRVWDVSDPGRSAHGTLRTVYEAGEPFAWRLQLAGGAAQLQVANGERKPGTLLAQVRWRCRLHPILVAPLP
jgi:hypothetical protein